MSSLRPLEQRLEVSPQERKTSAGRQPAQNIHFLINIRLLAVALLKALFVFVAGAMTSRSRKRVYAFEPEPWFQVMLETALAAEEASVTGFSEPQAFLEALASRPCDLLILDLEGRESEGLELLERARRRVPWMQSLVIVAQAAVGTAIRAVKTGAGDCLDEPVDQERLLVAVRTQLAKVDTSTHRRPRALTPIEVQILQMILAGKTSFEMADDLHRSKRTIDVHRKNIMRKLQATGLVDLIKRALGMGFVDHQPDP